MRATRFSLRASPLRENALQPVQGTVSERLREALRGFTLRLRRKRMKAKGNNLLSNNTNTVNLSRGSFGIQLTN